jgi:hypothetical protein
VAASVALIRQPVSHPAGTAPSRTAADACPATPVPPVLSGSDQASATPSITISHLPTDWKPWNSMM